MRPIITHLLRLASFSALLPAAQAEGLNPLLAQSSETPAPINAPEFALPTSTDAATERVNETTDDTAPDFALPADTEAAAGDSMDDSMEAGEGQIYHILPDFVVSTEGDTGYYSANTTSTTRANSLVKNTPITLSVINQEMLEDLNILTDEDLELASPSIEGESNDFSLNKIKIRGFRSGSSRYDLYIRSLARDGYNTDRLDIIRGANSLIYGQATPGGKVNFVPKTARFNDSFVTVSGQIGNKDYRRGILDINQVVNDKVAVRVMAVDHAQSYDQKYRSRTLNGATLEATYKPTDKTQLRLHLETVDSKLYYPSKNMTDQTRRDATGILNGMQYSPEAVALLPQNVVDAVITDPTNISRGVLSSREAIAQLYSDVSKEDYGSFEGPDTVNSNEGFFGSVDWTQQVSDRLQFKIGYNHQDVFNDSINRAGSSAVRLYDTEQADPNNPTPSEPNGETYLQSRFTKADGDTITDGIRATLLWDVEFKESKHSFLFGYDFDRSRINTLEYDEVLTGTYPNDPTTPAVLRSTPYVVNGAYNSGNNPYSTAYGSDFLLISDGTGGPNTSYDTDANNDLGVNQISINPNNGNPRIRGPYPSGPTELTLRTDKRSKSDVHGIWGAIQSEFFNGRLRTLAGLRYDTLDIEASELNVADLGLDGDRFPVSSKESQLSPSIGGLYWITDEVGIFANYAHSIASPNAIQRTVFGELPDAQIGKGIEGGFRFDLFDSKLNGQIVAFYIEKENDISDNLNNSQVVDAYPLFNPGGLTYPELYVDTNETTNRAGNLKENVGKRVNGIKTRSEGVEVEFYYNPNRNLTFTFAYAYTNYDRIETPAEVAETLGNEQIFGHAPHNATLIASYKFDKRGPLKGFSIGANQRYRSKSVGQQFEDAAGNIIGELEYDDEFTTGAFIAWSVKMGSARNAPQLGLRLTVSNLFNNTDLINRGERGFYKESRNITLSGNLKF